MAKKEEKKIPKKIGLAYSESDPPVILPGEDGETVEQKFVEAVVFYEGHAPEIIAYDPEHTEEIVGLANDLVERGGSTTYDEEVTKGTLLVVEKPSKEYDALMEEYKAELAKWEEKTEEEVKSPNLAWIKWVAAGLGVASLTGALIGIIKSNPHDKDKDADDFKIDDDTELEDILDLIKDKNSLKYRFYKNAIDMMHTFNEQTHKDGVFKLATDGEQRMNMSFDEAVSYLVLSGEYNQAELTEIFGKDTTLLPNELESSYTNLYKKLSTYSMNAKEPSGMADYIRNPESRALFTQFENLIIEYNNNPTQENADKIIAAYDAGFLADSSPVKSGAVDKTTAHLIGAMVEGHALSVPREHLIMSTTIGGTTAGLALTDIGDKDGNLVKRGLTSMVGESACLENVTQASLDIAEMVTYGASASAIDNVAKKLEDAGFGNVASKVRTERAITNEIADEIGKVASIAGNDILGSYYDEIRSEGPSLNEFMYAANNEAAKINENCRVEDLVNNRSFENAKVAEHTVIDDNGQAAVDRHGVVENPEDLEDESKLPDIIADAVSEGGATVISSETSDVVTYPVDPGEVDRAVKAGEEVVNEEGHVVDDTSVYTAENAALRAQLEAQAAYDANGMTETSGYTISGNFLDIKNATSTEPVATTITGSLYELAVTVASSENSTVYANGGATLTIEDSRISGIVTSMCEEDMKEFKESLDDLSPSMMKYLMTEYGVDSADAVKAKMCSDYTTLYKATVSETLASGTERGRESYQVYQAAAQENLTMNMGTDVDSGLGMTGSDTPLSADALSSMFDDAFGSVPPKTR